MPARAAPDGLPMIAFTSDAEALDVARFTTRHGVAFLVFLSGSAPVMAVANNPLGSPLGATMPPLSPQGAKRVSPTRTDDGQRTGAMRIMVYPLVRLPTSKRDGVTVGRIDGCDVVLRDETISRHHATLVPAAGGFDVIDEGSRNGTTVEGLPVAPRGKGPPVVVTSGQTVRFGGVAMQFVDSRGLIDLVQRFKGSYS